jgi:hypothetical protein
LPRLHASRAKARWRALGFRPEILAAGPVRLESTLWVTRDALPGCRCLPHWISRSPPVRMRTGRSQDGLLEAALAPPAQRQLPSRPARRSATSRARPGSSLDRVNLRPRPQEIAARGV